MGRDYHSPALSIIPEVTSCFPLDTGPGESTATDRLVVDDALLAARLATLLDDARSAAALRLAMQSALGTLRHGDLPRWRSALESLPALAVTGTRLDTPTIRVLAAPTDAATSVRLARALRSLVPWRKGPFRIADLEIDAEWRSDRKWARVTRAISPLTGRRVLDVGCGNGYYLWRMRGAGARAVLGLDPSLAALMQQQAIARYLNEPSVLQLPLPDSALDTIADSAVGFDTVFSMGVLYHHREPDRHLLRLREVLRPGGELLLETLVWPGEESRTVSIDGRYAGMRNVHTLSTVPALCRALAALGLQDVRVVDVGTTTPGEQRRTPWMPYRSLRDRLAADGRLTIEGHPRPLRAMIVARRRSAGADRGIDRRATRPEAARFDGPG